MPLTNDLARARRYLLGRADEAELLAIERQYFTSEPSLDLIEAAEGDLIEDYLAGQLAGEELASFEREYLASLHHRHRVEVVRCLVMPQTAMVTPPKGVFQALPRYLVLAIAAGAIVLGAIWARQCGAG